MPDSRGDVEEDLGPESEEVDDEESPMQFSSSVGAVLPTLILPYTT